MIRKMATLHFICGKAGSGKTTLARKLASRYAAALFCEDERLTLLDAQISDVRDYIHHVTRVRAALALHLRQLLQLNTSVVLDFAGNTLNERAWTRSIFESAGADHMLHVIAASDELCKARIRERNQIKPAGLYYGAVTECDFDAVTRFFVPPSDEENFQITHYDAAAV